MKYPENIENWPDEWKSCFEDGVKSQADRIATLEAELFQVKAQNYKLLDDCEKEETRAEKAEAEVARLREALWLCRPIVEAVRLKQQIPPTEEAYSSMIMALATRQG